MEHDLLLTATLEAPINSHLRGGGVGRAVGNPRPGIAYPMYYQRIDLEAGQFHLNEHPLCATSGVPDGPPRGPMGSPMGSPLGPPCFGMNGHQIGAVKL